MLNGWRSSCNIVQPGGTGLWSALTIGTAILYTTTCHWPDMDQHQHGMWQTWWQTKQLPPNSHSTPPTLSSFKLNPKPCSASLNVSNDYTSLSASCTWGCPNCTVCPNYMATKSSNKTSRHLQGTVEDPLTSNEVTCLFIYSRYYVLLLHAITTSRYIQGYYLTNDTMRLHVGIFW